MKTIPQHTLDFIDSWLELRYLWTNMPGFSVAIAKDGNVIFDKSYGFADTEKKEKLTTKHRFRIASHSKTFTATAVMQLQERGKLKIDDSIVLYLDWLREHKDKRWQEVTLRQLLSHSAGVIRDGEKSDFWQLSQPFPNKQELKSAILKSKLILDPNSKMKYSNFGYSLLGEVIEAASGVSYNDFVTQNIIEPLELKNTTPEYGGEVPFSNGYSRRNPDNSRFKLPTVSTNAMSSATGFCSTASDLVEYFSAQLIGSGKLLKDISKREMQRSHWEVSGNAGWYCLGFEGKDWDGRRVIGHGGGFPGFITQTRFDPKDKLVISVLTNCHGGDASLINRSIFSIIDKLGDKNPNRNLLKYETRTVDLGGINQYVASEDGLLSIFPNKWFPFFEVDLLEKVDDTTFRIKDAINGYYSEGELVSFKFDDDGVVEGVADSGIYTQTSIDGSVPITWK